MNLSLIVLQVNSARRAPRGRLRCGVMLKTAHLSVMLVEFGEQIYISLDFRLEFELEIIGTTLSLPYIECCVTICAENL
jgi:hypothetical protein